MWKTILSKCAENSVVKILILFHSAESSASWIANLSKRAETFVAKILFYSHNTENFVRWITV